VAKRKAGERQDTKVVVGRAGLKGIWGLNGELIRREKVNELD